MPENYAKFLKCALQVNPWTYAGQYQGISHGLDEYDYNAAVVGKCVSNGIQVAGIADHGCVDQLESLRKALESAGIVVFPGFEIASTEKIHMVCLYPAGTGVTALNQYLGNLDLPGGGKKTAPSSLGCLQLAERIQKQGGFWYAAHITGANGLLRLNKDGGGLAHIWTDCERVFAAQIPADIAAIPEQGIQQILRNKNPDYFRPRRLALLNSKDVRHPDDLDNPRACSWIKMTAPTFEALQLACRDPESRVRLSHEINPTYYSRIERITATRGYLEELELDLSPNLNAIVGGRGTGKSTLIEALRFVLDRKPTDKDALRAHEGIIDANFALEKAGIAITLTSYRQNCERYVISRFFGQPAKVLDEAGNVLSLAPKDVLPDVEIYGQNELLAVVKDDGAKARLLGRFLPDDGENRNRIADLHNSLRKNREEIDAIESRIEKMAASLEQLPGLMDREKSYKKLALQAELEQVKLREAKREYVTAARSSIEELTDAAHNFRGAVGAVELPELTKDIPESSVKAFSESATAAHKRAIKAAADVITALEDNMAAFDSAKKVFEQGLQTEEEKFHKSIQNLPTSKGKSAIQLSGEYQKVSAAIAKLKPLSAQKIQQETRRVALLQARETLLENLQKARGIRWTELGQAVKKLNRRLEGQIRVSFEPGRNRKPLKDFLMECDLDGVGEKRLAWIDACENLTVSELIGLIRQGEDALLEQFRSLGMQKQVAEALTAMSGSDLRKLEEVELPERLELLLNVAPGAQSFREVGRLSTGQQCTAILHLLLLDNPDPLILDQPEDNLDNAFIAEHIVAELRSGKTRRQFIFATHNANIPVFGDAEWIGVLHEVDNHARLQASGSIDTAAVKDLAANILEGGREAFTRRREKYGL